MLAISVLDQTQRRRANDVEARLILSHWTDADPEAAEALLERGGRQIDPDYRKGLILILQGANREKAAGRPGRAVQCSIAVRRDARRR